MVGQFSEQLQRKNEARQTRTQRLIEVSRTNSERDNFNRLRAEAEALKSKFVNLTPEEYANEYQNLNPEIRQFFATPQEVAQRQEQGRQTQAVYLQNKINSNKAKLQGLIEEKQKFMDEFNQQTGQYKQENLEDYRRRLNNYSLKISELQDKINYASEDANKINSGVTADQIWGSAVQRASEDRANTEALLKISKEEGLTPSQYETKVTQENKKAQYLKGILAWQEKVGYSNLPDYAKEKINPTAQEWQKANPTEILQFDKDGNVIAIKSGILNKTLSVEEYNKLANQTPQDVYADWQKERAKKPYYIDVNVKDVTLPYEEKGTINANASTKKVYPLLPTMEKTKENDSFISKITSYISKFISKTPDLEIPIFYSTKGSVTGSLKVADLKAEGTKDLTNSINKKTEEMLSAIKDKETLDNFFKEQYQTRFEDAYIKKIIMGEMDFATASAEFEKSDTAKVISEQYNNAVIEETKKFPLSKKLLYGTQLAGLYLGKGAVSLIPTKTGSLVGESFVLYSGLKTIDAVPQAVNLAITGASFGYGTYKTFSKKSTPLEAGTGLITAGITGVSLAYTGYKWARSPTIKTVDVDVDKYYRKGDAILSRPETEVIKDAYGKTTVIKSYKFGKINTDVISGRRTIVSTKIRDLFGIKPIYEGVPYAQKGTKYYLSSLRGDYTFVTESAYKKALNKLLDYGYTKGEAVQTLRYYQPKIFKTELKGFTRYVYGDYYKMPVLKTEATRIIEQPSIDIDATLGIKTRGAKTIKEFITGKGGVVGFSGDKILYRTNYKIVKTFLTGEGGAYNKLNQAGKTTTEYDQLTLATVKGNKVFNKLVSRYPDLQIIKGYPAEDVLTQSVSKRVLPKSGKYQFYQDNIVALKGEKFRVMRDYQNDISIKELPQPKVENIKSMSDYTSKDLKKLIKSLDSIYGKEDIKAVISKTAKGGKFAGVPATSTTTLKASELKTISIPKTAGASKTKAIIKEILGSRAVLSVSNILASGLRSRQNLKVNTDLKYQLREMDVLKVNQANIQKLKELTKLKTGAGSSQAFRNITPTIELNILDFKNPPPYRPPKVPTPVMVSRDDIEKKIMQRRKERKTPEIVGLFPDFTARSIGLSPKVLSLKQALKEMGKIQTGLEIRTGGKLKSFSPIDEKKLLRGIMK